jgi:hypothetical protein
MAYGRARRTYAEFADRAGMPKREFAQQHASVRAHDPRGAVEASARCRTRCCQWRSGIRSSGPDSRRCARCSTGSPTELASCFARSAASAQPSVPRQFDRRYAG